MRKRFGVMICVLLAGGAVGFLLWRSPYLGEPSFDGRTLTMWLEFRARPPGAKPPYNSTGWKDTDEAVRAIGSDGIPTLLKMIRAKDPPPIVLKMLSMGHRYGLPRMNYRSAEARQREAEYAFRLLGTNASSAVPGLIRIYRANISSSSQRYAAISLGNIGRSAQTALPTLIENFTHADDEVRFNAVSAVIRIGGDPDVVVQALTRVLNDPNERLRFYALSSLSRLGGLGRSAVPRILQMLNDEKMLADSRFKGMAETTLWRIAPECVGHPLVVEDPTVMIANGMTTQALKVVFHGKRLPLIQPGRPVPAVAQYPKSDPRPHLTLYRGSSHSDEDDHFLGQFEVLDFAESENVWVQTVVVVADGQIILCARDNHRDVFLEIRRVEDKGVK